MKYSLLTKEQFSELHREFINFLATQTITKQEWDTIKEKQPEVAAQEMEVFSDLVWEGVLQKAMYLENHSPNQLFLFKMEASKMQLIVVKVNKETIDLSTKFGLAWLQGNIQSDNVELFTASKSYSEDKNLDKFKLIKQGAIISEGTLFEAFQIILPN
jgi:hypothetical protein